MVFVLQTDIRKLFVRNMSWQVCPSVSIQLVDHILLIFRVPYFVLALLPTAPFPIVPNPKYPHSVL